jgi:hypothetical protein
MSERLIINKDNQKHIDAYINYRNIVGEDDGGKIMSDKEFEEYKKKVSEARKNHLYVYWVNGKGYECKAIGPESMCFCGHRYKSHNFDNVKTKKVNCKTAKCKCPLFDYIPVYGSNDVKCLCKHSYSLHDVNTKKCSKPGCKCSCFESKFTCNCTFTYDEHKTTIENREERQALGKTVDPGWMNSNLTAGIGGLNSFSGMMNDVYQLEYQALLNDPDKKQMIMEDMQNQKTNNKIGNIGIKKENSISVNNIQQVVSALELFNKPHKYGIGSFQSNQVSVLNNKFRNISLK